MTPAAWNWLLTIVGTIASAAGVVFSWMAWIQAGKAKDAARAAANAVQRRQTAYEVSKLSRDAKDFLESVQQSRIEAAISSSNNLAHALSTVRSWKVEPIGDSDKLKLCVKSIEQVAIQLRVDGIPINSRALGDLLGTCHEIHRFVCDMASKLEHLSEEWPYEQSL